MIGYEDRFEKELMYVTLEEFESEDVEVPLHRVQLLLLGEQVFWDRQRRVNRLHRFKEAAAAPSQEQE